MSTTSVTSAACHSVTPKRNWHLLDWFVCCDSRRSFPWVLTVRALFSKFKLIIEAPRTSHWIILFPNVLDIFSLQKRRWTQFTKKKLRRLQCYHRAYMRMRGIGSDWQKQLIFCCSIFFIYKACLYIFNKVAVRLAWGSFLYGAKEIFTKEKKERKNWNNFQFPSICLKTWISTVLVHL